MLTCQVVVPLLVAPYYESLLCTIVEQSLQLLEVSTPQPPKEPVPNNSLEEFKRGIRRRSLSTANVHFERYLLFPFAAAFSSEIRKFHVISNFLRLIISISGIHSAGRHCTCLHLIRLANQRVAVAHCGVKLEEEYESSAEAEYFWVLIMDFVHRTHNQSIFIFWGFGQSISLEFQLSTKHRFFAF